MSKTYFVANHEIDYMFEFDASTMVITPQKSPFAEKEDDPKKMTPFIENWDYDRTLPFSNDVAYIVLEFTIEYLIARHEYLKAHAVMLTSVWMVKKYFRKIYGRHLAWQNPFHPNPYFELYGMYKEIRFVFNFMKSLYTEVMLMEQDPDNTSEFFAIDLELIGPSTMDLTPSSFRSWGFGVKSINPPDFDGDLGGGREIYGIKSGLLMGDVTWINGTVSNGVYTAERIMRPVIVLGFYDNQLNTLEIEGIELQMFNHLAMFIKSCFGSTTTVFDIKEYVEYVDQDGMIVCTLRELNV